MVGNRGATVEALRGLRVDLALMGRPPRDFPVTAESFGPHPLVVIAAPDHRFARRHGLTREETRRGAVPGAGIRLGDPTVFEEFMTAS